MAYGHKGPEALSEGVYARDGRSEVRAMTEEAALRRRVRAWMLVFIVGLVVSGVTAFPLVWEVDVLARLIGATDAPGAYPPGGLPWWLATVREGLHAAADRYPFLFYGTDWLAFGHLVIALFFLGPLRDPVRNVFILRVGIAACVLVWPLALLCGPLRGIPFWWQLIDCSFGVFGLVPLLLCLRDVRRLEQIEAAR
jgi:hypothetical protein